MVLIDTSVLIDFFKGNNNEKVRKFEDILDKGIPFGINNYIYQELLQGAKTIKEYGKLKKYLGSQRFYDIKKGRRSYETAALMYLKCRKKGITIRSTIDIIIVQTAIENNLYLLHNDKDFSYISNIQENLKIY